MFTVYGEPQGKARPRFTNRGGYTRSYTPKKTVDYEKQIAAAYNGEKLSGPVLVEVLAVFGIPKSTTKKNRALMLDGIILPEKKSDADNILKAVMDGLNGVAYDDDKQVIRAACTKTYGEEPRIEVIVSEYTK